MKTIFKYAFILLLMTACGNKKPQDNKTNQKTESITTPQFNADSAFIFTKKQTDFGPRVPGTEAHKACLQYLTQTLEKYSAKVNLQSFEAKGYNGKTWTGTNITGSYLPKSKDRIILCAHWDSRFIAEQDKNLDLQHSPIDGANDGASGVGVLLEIARQLHHTAPNTGIDIIFFDVEDQGAPAYAASAETEDSWCLGAQHWSKEAKKNGYEARWGILLDMVGASDAVFMKEQISEYYAKQLVDYVWDIAAQKGYSEYFINNKGGIITDDHLYVNKIAEIPCIDIVDYDNAKGGFSNTWHTHDDNIDNIDKNTLKAVGDIILEVVRQQ